MLLLIPIRNYNGLRAGFGISSASKGREGA